MFAGRNFGRRKSGRYVEKKEQTSGAKTESGYAKNAKLKVWGSQEDQEMYKKMIEAFQKEVPEAADWEIELAVVMGADAKTELLKRCIYSSRCI